MKGTQKINPSDSKLDPKLQTSINRSNVESIKKSNIAMRDELNAEVRLSSITGAQTASKIAKLQEKGTFYAKQIEIEAKKLHDLERQIEIVQDSVNDKKTKLRKVEGNASTDSLSKDIKKLERSLDKTLQKHNEVLAENRQLKEEIDHLRRERVTFDKIYKKLEVELQAKKKTLCEVFGESEKAKDRKKKIEDQIKTLRLRVMKEESNIEKEFQDLFKDINERTLIDRVEERFGPLQERSGPLKKRDNESPSKVTNVLEDSRTGGDEDPLRSSVRKGGKSGEKRTKEPRGKTPQEEVEEYNAVFENLKKKTHKNDLKDILSLYEDYQTSDYSLYQHLSNLSDEKETLEKQIREIKTEIKNLTHSEEKETVLEQGGDTKVQKVQEIKEEIEESEKHHKYLESKQNTLMETMETLKVSIPIIFERLGCNADDYASEMLDGKIVNEGNLLQYLAIIEKKTNEILQMYHFSQSKIDNIVKTSGLQRKVGEESNLSASNVFPTELFNDLTTAAPEKAEMQTIKDFEEDAKKRVRQQLEKKSHKSSK